jgi:hypothetical protein
MRLYSNLSRGSAREVVWAHVMFFQYYIEGEPCPASTLTVTPDNTPNLDETKDGFRCDALFPDKILSPHVLAVGQKMMSGAHERHHSSETRRENGGYCCNHRS